jgi:hypothetical protein
MDDHLPPPLSTDLPNGTSPAAVPASASEQAYQLVTEEEFNSVITKLQQFVQLPAGHLQKEDELYLEQQLSDVFGFEVLAESESFRLPYTVGVMGARQHLRRFPEDRVDDHARVPEAGLAVRRSAFGWFTEMGQVTPNMIAAEQYTVSFAAELLSNWVAEENQLRELLRFHKVLVINPLEQLAVVAALGDTGPYQDLQVQFGGSPELIRDGRIWSIPAQGKVMVFLIHDGEKTVPLGVRSLIYDRR